MDSLYHYTNIDSLLGMLSKYSATNPFLTLWATHCMFTNDKSEFRYGAYFLNKIIKDIESLLKIPTKEQIQDVINHPKIIEFQKQLFKNYETTKYSAPFISSFSKAKNSLPMWIVYSQNGSGICIEFDKQLLREYFIITTKYPNINSEIGLLAKQISPIYQKIKEIHQPTNEVYKIISFALHISAVISPTIKHVAFGYEQEVRLIKYSDKVKFRASNSHVIPYTEIQIPISAVRAIHIGPKADSNIVKSLTYFLFNKGLEHIKIIKSDIPYCG